MGKLRHRKIFFFFLNNLPEVTLLVSGGVELYTTEGVPGACTPSPLLHLPSDVQETQSIWREWLVLVLESK